MYKFIQKYCKFNLRAVTVSSTHRNDNISLNENVQIFISSQDILRWIDANTIQEPSVTTVISWSFIQVARPETKINNAIFSSTRERELYTKAKLEVIIYCSTGFFVDFR